jgi:hypothetical protein
MILLTYGFSDDVNKLEGRNRTDGGGHCKLILSCVLGGHCSLILVYILGAPVVQSCVFWGPL